MKIKTTIGEILPLLYSLNRIALGNSVLNAINTNSNSMVLFQPFEKDSLKLTASGGENQLTCLLKNISYSGNESILLPAQKLLNACSKGTADAVLSIEGDDKEACLKIGEKAGVRSYKLKTLPSKSFALQEKPIDATTFQIQARDLKYLLEMVHFAMAKNNTQQGLDGVLLELDEGKIIAVAADGHRLAKSELPLPKNKKKQKYILPRKAVVDFLLHGLEDSEDEVTVSVIESQIQMVYKDQKLVSQLLSAEYPNYQNVIPKQFNFEVSINIENLRKSIDSACVIAESNTPRIDLSFKKNILQVSSNNDLNENAVVEQEVDYSESTEVKIRFNAKYILDILSSTQTEEIVLSIMDSNTAAQITEKGNKAVQNIIMPVRI